jgi:perosamine synthetase
MVVVHSFGAPSSLFSASFPDVVLIEDGASSLGARVDDMPVGRMGLSSVFSFGSTKMMTTGQGGMILTDDAEQIALIDKIRDYDCALPGASSDGPGFNYNLSDLQATLGMSQLSRLDDFIERRRAIASSYTSVLRGMPDIELPHGPQDGRRHAYYRYVFLTDAAPAVVELLQKDGIDARSSVTHFLNDSKSEFPGCEAVRSRIVSLPIYPSLTDSQVERITSSLSAALSR